MTATTDLVSEFWEKHFTVRDTGGGEWPYRMRCPLNGCDEDKSDTDWRNFHFRVTSNGLSWQCMKCHAATEGNGSYVALAKQLNIELPERRDRQIRKVYQYHDTSGKLLYEKVRFDDDIDPKILPRLPGAAKFGLSKETPRVLWNLPALRHVQADSEIVIFEGEQDAERGQEALGVVGTTKPFGVKSACQKAWCLALAGKSVTIVYDCDQAGREGAVADARALWDTTEKIRIVDIDVDRNDGYDVSDLLQEHGANALRDLVNETEWLTEKPGAPEQHADDRNVEQRFHFTDLGNAERLVARHGHDLRYCHTHRSWYIWDGCRWRRDDTAEIWRRAQETVRQMFAEASTIHEDDDRKGLARHALKCESERQLRAMISLVSTQAGVPVLPEQMDRDSLLLNCLNGTIDLRTGRLRPHSRDDLITKLSPVDHNPDASCSRWLQFLLEIMDGDEEMVGFLQRMVGYSLTGDTREQCLFFLHGVGSNGKSTFLKTIGSVLGDYAMWTPVDTLLTKRGDTIPNDVARLAGARLVCAAEADEGRRLAEGLVKQMTGDDKIPARFMRAEWFEFEPTFKIFLAANHKPVIRGTDYAIWRRIKLIPFEVKFFGEDEDGEPKKDLGLSEKLLGELPGILAWAVKGCMAWQVNGLMEPARVKAATAEYKSELDIIQAFIDERCVVGMSQYRVQASALYNEFKTWCSDSGERDITRTMFGKRLADKGYHKTRESSGIWYEQIGLSG